MSNITRLTNYINSITNVLMCILNAFPSCRSPKFYVEITGKHLFLTFLVVLS